MDVGVIEDVRQLLQDLVAPQLKAVDARLTALEHEVRSGFARLEAIMAEMSQENKAAVMRLENQINLARSRQI